MEKYRSTADPSTGLHPFLPPARPPAWQIFLQALFFYPLRLPFVVLFGVAYVLLRFILVGLLRLLRLHFLARPFERLADNLLRLLLLSCGIVHSSPVGRLQKAPSHGDVIFSNHSSYLDVLYLTAFFSPNFLVPHAQGFSLLTPLDAFKWSASGCGEISQFKTETSITAFRALAKDRSAGPLVLFAEGGSTNGVGVLRFPSCTSTLRGTSYAIGLSYSSKRGECFTIGSSLSHFACLLAKWKSCIKSRITVLPDTTAVDMQREVARLVGVPVLRIDAETRIKFREHWASSSGGKGVKQYKK